MKYQLGNPRAESVYLHIWSRFGVEYEFWEGVGWGAGLSKRKGNGILRRAILAIRISLFEN